MSDLSTIDLTTRTENGEAIDATLYDATITAIQTAINLLVNHVNPLGNYSVRIGNGARAGAAAGWVTASGLDYCTLATLPASKSAATLVVPLNLPIGVKITAYEIYGQIESGGNTVTLDASIRKVTVAAADLVDAAVAGTGLTQISVTADTAVDESNGRKSGLSVTTADGEAYYLRITGTTAASTDIALSMIELDIEEVVAA